MSSFLKFSFSNFCCLILITGLSTGSHKEETALLVLGGTGALTSGEVWSPLEGQTVCLLPPLTRELWSHSVDWVEDNVLACSDFSCDRFTPGGSGGWEVGDHLLSRRWQHTTAITSRGLLLLGGYHSKNTTEILGGGPSFSLEEPRAQHCSIQVNVSTLVVTGGAYGSESSVVEYSNLDGQVTRRELAPLETGRWEHACASYTVGYQLMLIVSGGFSGEALLSSTEVLDYSSGSKSWRLVGSLPFPLYATRATNVAGIVYLAAGYDGASYTSSVFSWDGVAEVWTESGRISYARGYHALTEVPLKDFCS